MNVENDQDLARGFPPPNAAYPSAPSAESSTPRMLWDNQGYRWNGFDSWSAKVEDYLRSGFVSPEPRPGFAAAVPHFQSFKQSQRETLSQFEDGELIVTAGPLYSVADLAAALRRLSEETAFTVPDFMMAVDPRVPGKGFLILQKVEHIDGASLEYRVSGEDAADCLNLFGQIQELLLQAKKVLEGEFFVGLDDPTSWGLTKEGIARARARLPLTQSDMVILKPVV